MIPVTKGENYRGLSSELRQDLWLAYWKEYWAVFRREHTGEGKTKFTLLEILKYLTGIRRGQMESGKEGVEHLQCDSECANAFPQIPKQYRRSGFKSWVHHLLALEHWMNYLSLFQFPRWSKRANWLSSHKPVVRIKWDDASKSIFAMCKIL